MSESLYMFLDRCIAQMSFYAAHESAMELERAAQRADELAKACREVLARTDVAKDTGATA